MPDVSTPVTGAATDDAVDEIRERNLDGNHPVDLAVELGEDRIQELSLRHRPRVTVEDRAAFRIRLREALLDELTDHLVGHEPAVLHEAVETAPEVAPARPLGPHHVPGRDLRDAQHVRQALGLRTLAGARRPEED